MRAAQNQLMKIEIQSQTSEWERSLTERNPPITHLTHIYSTEESADCMTRFSLMVSEVTEIVCRVG